MGVVATKTPAEVKDFTIDWTKYLSGDAIVTSSWGISLPDITASQQSSTSTHTTVWLSGGDIGSTYVIENTIVTVAGRTLTAAFKLKVHLINQA